MRGIFFAAIFGLTIACSEPQPMSEVEANSVQTSNQESITPVLNPDEAIASFAIAPKFKIELVASEPLIEDPVAIAWDETGNLYVAEMRAFMLDVHGTDEEKPIGTVVRLFDEDGDGLFDRREVLLDGLVLPRALRIVNDGLLVAEMGKLWLCPTTSGWSKDIDCNQKQFLGGYGEHQGSVEHAENGLLVGLDNWIYSAKSARRLKLVDGELIEEPTLFRGQWGITQDEVGRFLYNTNSNLLLGDFYDAQALVATGQRSAPGLNVRVSPNDEVFAIRKNEGVNRAYIPGVLRDDGRLRSATSASGMVVYQGALFDAEDPDVFVAEPAANVVAAFKLKSSGITLLSEQQVYEDEEWGQRDFLASTDERFRPVDLVNGPDGALYVVDFYRGVIQDHVFLSDYLRGLARERELDRPLGMGRIWRIAKAETESQERSLPNWAGAEAGELVEMLSAREGWRRETAQRLLLRESNPDTDTLLGQSVSTGGDSAAVRSLWILKDRGALTEKTVTEALNRGGVAAEAALLVGKDLLAPEILLTSLAQLEPDSRAYLYTLAALGQSMSMAEVLDRILSELIAQHANAHVRAFVLAAVRGHEPQFVSQLIKSEQWNQTLETKTGMLAALAQQLVIAEGANAEVLLDYVVSRPSGEEWVQRAVLLGLFGATREPGFERVQLSKNHAVFDITDEALWPAVSKARRAFTWPGDTLSEDAKPLTPQQAELMASGEQFYTQSCANCHGVDGTGVGALGPPLAESKWVTEAPERLARIVLHGLQGPIEVLGQEWNSAMPGHRDYPGFDDRVASGLLTYLRRSWGHSGRAIDPEFLSEIQVKTKERTALWTAAELMEIDVNTHYQKYVGKYGRPDAPMGFTYDGKDLVISAGFIEGPVIEQKEDHFLFAPRGFAFEFVVDADGDVSGIMLDMGNGMVTLPRLP